jgi:hypothetical protein
MSKRKDKKEEEVREEKRLAVLMRGVRPKQRGGFHSPKKKAEKTVEDRRANRKELHDAARRYNSKESE